MARKAGKPAVIEKPDTDMAAVAGQLEALDARAEEEMQRGKALALLASDLHYEGALTVASLEDEIRFYRKRTSDAVLELGKRLLLLRQAIPPRGGFIARVQSLGIERHLAHRFMAAADKFSRGERNTPLIGGLNQSKILELVVLDDEEVALLEAGEDVRGVTLDAIDCLSTSELRKKLREAKQQADTDKAVKTRKDELINELQEELGRKPKPTPEMAEAAVLESLHKQTLRVVNEIETGLRGALSAVTAHFEDGPLPNHMLLAMQQGFSQAIQAARIVAGDFGITLEESVQAPVATLSWLTEAEKVFGQAPGATVIDVEPEA